MPSKPKASQKETDASLSIAICLVLAPLLWLGLRACMGNSQSLGDHCVQRKVKLFDTLHERSPNTGEVSQMMRACQQEQLQLGK